MKGRCAFFDILIMRRGCYISELADASTSFREDWIACLFDGFKFMYCFNSCTQGVY
jgi:hypothetical protein